MHNKKKCYKNLSHKEILKHDIIQLMLYNLEKIHSI